MDVTLLAAKIHDDNKRISFYADQLLTMIQKEFRTKKIDRYDYSYFVSVLSCLKLQTQETRNNIDDFIEKEMNKRIKVDYKV